jgi:hypothetical protein
LPFDCSLNSCTDSIGSDDGCQIDNFLDNRLEKAQHLSKSKQSKPRRTLSKVTSGRTITEDENFLKIKEFREQSKGSVSSTLSSTTNGPCAPKMRADVNGLSSSIIFCVSLLSFNFCFLMF